jgi:hypothetical protein
MAITSYTESEIKALVLNWANSIKKLTITFTDSDSDEAYDSAVRDCGFEVPESDDEYLAFKNQWIIERQRYFYLRSVRDQHILFMDSGDLQFGGITERITKILNEMDKRFDEAKNSATTAHLFITPEMLFGEGAIVVDSGFVNDRMGQDIINT